MVVTHDGLGGDLRARPMAARLARRENAIYFLTNADSGKVEEVHQNRSVCLAFVDSKAKDYVSITGLAATLNDRAKIRELWSFPDKAFWRDASDPEIRILRVEPETAEYWRSSGDLINAVRIVMASLGSAPPKLGDNEKVGLSNP